MEEKVRSGEMTPTAAAEKLGRLAGIGKGWSRAPEIELPSDVLAG